MILWIYDGVWICFLIEVCQGSEYTRDTQGSEYVWVCSWIMLEYDWIYLKQNLKYCTNEVAPIPAGTRHLQDILELSWNCLVSIRHFQDIYKPSSCIWLAVDISKIS